MFFLFGPSGTDRVFQKDQLALIEQTAYSWRANWPFCLWSKTLVLSGQKCCAFPRIVFHLLSFGRERAAFWPFWDTSLVPEGPIGIYGIRGLFYKGQLALLEHAVCSIRAKLKIVSNIYFEYISSIYLIYIFWFICDICFFLFGPSGTHIVFQVMGQLALIEQIACSRRANWPF